MSNLYHSYFDTVSADRRSPPKRSSPTKKATQEPPKKLSKAFTRQLAKTLATSKKPLKKKKTNTTKRKRTYSAKMPKRAAAESYDSDGGFVEDAPKSKKSKAKSTTELPSKEKDKDGAYWEISGKRRLQLSEFKGNTMIGVREYYEKNGEALPGKKGISMTLDQFNTVIELLPQLEAELKKSGGKLSRPKYEGVVVEEEKVVEEDDEEDEKEAKARENENEEEEEKPVAKKAKSKLDKFKHKSKNHEATSDEDE